MKNGLVTLDEGWNRYAISLSLTMRHFWTSKDGDNFIPEGPEFPHRRRQPSFELGLQRKKGLKQTDRKEQN